MALTNEKNELRPREVVYHTHNGADAPRVDGTLTNLPQAFVADPSGGAVIDAEARTAINSILNILENTGLMKSS